MVDNGRAILPWTKHVAVPDWSEDANKCTRCLERLQRSHSHNCRLCGQLFCSLCTGKFHVPGEFRRKAKTGPVRVCFACVQSCVDERDKHMGPGITELSRPGLRRSVDEAGRIHYHAPVWSLPRKHAFCHICDRDCGKGAICHCCGSIHCSDCTASMDVPPSFRKQGKNPVRVCLHCRFDLFGGAILDEEPLASATPGSRKSLSELPSVRDAGGSVSDSNDDADPVVRIAVQWESASFPVTTVRVRPSVPLDDLHEQLCGEMPTLRSRQFSYLCRGRPVHKDHWDIFTANHVRPVLWLRECSSSALSPPASLPAAMHSLSFSDKAPGRTHSPSDQQPTKQQPGHPGSRMPTGSAVHRKTSGPIVAQPDVIGQVTALFSLESTRENFLSFSKGDVIDLLIRKPDSKWWFGQLCSQEGVLRKGWIPSNYVAELR
ncbi:FYVE-type domain-containing protein [Plasmodiophora brassicae]|uniref:FYVE-type domain-containing protein n=1 Tax=Plasmodiophora brassicae TaxID=37360 RepID=A0A0G4IP37_PLABS|nr:hypothetical protein PBRA_005620 [Plasmodiophora brassicae]SPR00996.1 unnamed protein product [Plasmodiophora brassicae]